MDLGTRINQIQDHLGLNLSQLATKVGLSRQALDKVIKKTTKDPRGSFFLLFQEELNVNAAWLITGKGSMFLTNLEPDYEEQVKSLKNEVNTLNKEISILRQMIDLQTEKINTLKAQNSGKPSN